MIMVDVDQQLARIEIPPHGWTMSAALAVARELASQTGGIVDWDEGAGEAWARILLDRHAIALVHLSAPLLILAREAPLYENEETALIRVDNMSDRCLKLTAASAARVFPGTETDPVFEAEIMSPLDLYAATV